MHPSRGSTAAVLAALGVLAVAPVAVAPAHAADAIGPRVLSVVLAGGAAPSDLSAGEATHAGDRITVRFDEPVTVDAEDLRLAAGRGPRPAPTFRAAADGLSATWTWPTMLPSDGYALRLSDRVTDLSGNRLDGEGRGEGTSGNGIPGGDLRTPFDLVAGDADLSGTTDAADLADTQAAPAEVRAEVRAHLGDRASPLAPDTSLLVAGLGDADGDGTDEVATLQESPTPRIRVQGADDAVPERDITLSDRYHWLALAATQRPDGPAPSFAALGVDERTGSYRISLWDRSGGVARTWVLGRSEIPLDLVAWQAADGSADLAVLGRTPSADTARLRVLHSANGTSSVTTVAVGVDAARVVWSPATGAASSELTVVARRRSSDTSRVHRFDADTLARLASFPVGAGAVSDASVLGDPVAGERRYVLLRAGTATSASVEVRRPDGVLVSRRSFPVAGTARRVAAWVDANVLRVGVLDVDSTTGATRFAGVDASGTHPFVTSFGAGRAGTGLALVRAQGAIGLAVAERNTAVGLQQVQVRAAEGNHRVRTLPLPGPASADDWFLGHRVHGHTRWYPWHPTRAGFYGVDGYERAAADIADVGAHVFTRSGRHYDEDPWWPSEVPLDATGHQQFLGPRTEHGIALAAGRSLLQESVTEAWAHDEPMLAYYNDMSEASVAAAHPDWVCRDATGAPATHETKGTFLDITGPYGAVVRQRLLELADAGASGAYLDFRHTPAGGCYGSALAAEYQATHGSVPAPGRTPAYQQFLEFSARRLDETLDGWRRAVQREYPSFRVLTSVTSVPALTRLEMDSRLGVGGDTKSEFAVAIARGQSNSVLVNNPTLPRPDDQVRIGFGLALLRDAHHGHGDGVAHVWKGPSPTVGQDRSFVGAVTTFGVVAAYNLDENVLAGRPAAGFPSRADYASVFALGDRLSPALAHTAPIGQAAVVFSERERNALFPSGDVQIWKQQVLPALGGFDALTRSGLSPGVLNDDALSAGIPSAVRALWVPDEAGLTAGQKAAVDAFRARGGRVLGDGLSGLAWATQPEYDASVVALERQIATDPQPVRVTGLPARAMAAGYVAGSGTGTRLTVAVTNGFAHVQSAAPEETVPAGAVNPQPDPVPGGALLTVDLARLGATSAADLRAFDALTGTPLQVAGAGPGDAAVTLPGFDEVFQVTVVHR